MEAFQLCLDHQVPVVELDVHLCGDGSLAVIHDDNSRRTTGIDSLIAQSGWDQLKDLDAGSWKNETFSSSRIPRLEDVFSSFGRSLYFDIELKQRSTKDSGLPAAVWKVISSFGMEDRCYVSSFNPLALRRFSRLCESRVATAVIYCRSEELPKMLRKGFGRRISGSQLVKPDHTLIQEALAKFRGFPLIPWTVDSRSEVQSLFELGVEGVITNRPIEMMEIRAAFLR
jgi:glycerophosphoryl diester phosphodiesterase